MINVIGLGYIGLPTALMLAAHGQEVVGTDLSEAVVSNLNNGRVSLMEAGIEDLYRRALDGGIRFSTRYQKADIYIISVPTPYIQETKQVDAAYVEAAIDYLINDGYTLPTAADEAVTVSYEIVSGDAKIEDGKIKACYFITQADLEEML